MKNVLTHEKVLEKLVEGYNLFSEEGDKIVLRFSQNDTVGFIEFERANLMVKEIISEKDNKEDLCKILLYASFSALIRNKNLNQ